MNVLSVEEDLNGLACRSGSTGEQRLLDMLDLVVKEHIAQGCCAGGDCCAMWISNETRRRGREGQ